MSAENETASRRLVEEGWNGGDLGAIEEIVHPEAVYHDPANPEAGGRSGIRHFVAGYRSAFPDARLTIEDMFSQGDKVVSRWTARGTHRGEFMGLAPTGRPITVTGITIDRYADGRIVEAWGNWDTLGLLRQIDAAPVRRNWAQRLVNPGISARRIAGRGRRTGSGPAS